MSGKSPIMEMVHETATGLHKAGVISDAKKQEFNNLTGHPDPRVGISVYIIHDNKLLLGKRKGSHAAGYWATPGGHLDYGESLEQCAEREVFEETGIKIKDIIYGPYVNEIFEQDHKHYVSIHLFATWDSGIIENKEPHKCEGWEWFDLNELPSPLFPSTARLVEQGMFSSTFYSKETGIKIIDTVDNVLTAGNRSVEFLEKLADLMEEYKAEFDFTTNEDGIHIHVDRSEEYISWLDNNMFKGGHKATIELREHIAKIKG